MANFATKHSIMTQEIVDSFCNSFYIPAEVHPTAPRRGKTISEFPAGKGGILEKDPAPHLTTRQEQAVKLLESHKAPFRRYSECFLAFGFEAQITLLMKNISAFEYPDGRVQAVEVQKGADQVKLLESTEHCFHGHLVPRPGKKASRPQEGSSSAGRVRSFKKGGPDHPALASGTSGKTLAGLEQIRPAGSHLPDQEQLVIPSVAPPSQESEGFLDSSARTNLRICATVESSSALVIPVDTTAAATTSTGAAATTRLATDVDPDLAGPSHPEESEGSDDSFYAPTTLDPSEAKRWYVPRWSITNDSLLDDGFSCRTLVDHVAPHTFFSALRSMDYDQLYTKFNVRAARQVCLGAEVRSRAEHELELKEKLRVKYAARGRLLEEKDLEILELKSKLAEKEAEAAEVIRLRDQVSSLSEEKSALTAEVSALKVTITQKDHDISLLDSRATHLESLWAGPLILACKKVASADYVNAVKALEDAHFPLVDLLKSKKDAGMDEVLDCFLLDGPLAELPEAASLQPCIEQLSIPIHHAGDKTAVGETSLSFALMNVHARAEGAKKHAAALRQLMMEIVSAPLSSQTWVGEASISAAPLSVEDYAEEDTDEALGSVVAVPNLERCCL
ncbi:hypothetical protein Tco_0960975 [Tanacetum coccineum]